MAKKLVSEDLMMRYLLRDLPEEEQIRLEEQYFADNEVFEELSALEDELIDDYVRGQLSKTQRKQFAIHFLSSPKRRRKLAFAESFSLYLSEAAVEAPAARQKSWRQTITGWLGVRSTAARWVFAATGAVMLLVGAGLVRENWYLRTQLRQIRAERTELRQREEQLRTQLAQRSVGPTGTASKKEEETGSRLNSLPTVALTLFPGQVRSNAEQQTLSIPHGPHVVRLQVDVASKESYDIYLATLETAEGTRVWSKEGLKTSPESGTHVVVLELPSSLLDNKDYLLELRGMRRHAAIEDIGGYSFRVVKR